MEKAFELLLSSIRPKPVIAIDSTNNKFTISLDDQAIAEQSVTLIRHSLTSPQAFYANLPVELKIGETTVGNATPDPILAQTALPTHYPAEITVNRGIIFLENVCGSIFEECGVDIWQVFNADAKLEDGVIFSKPAKSRFVENVWQTLLDSIILSFVNQTIVDLRHAWIGTNTLNTSSTQLEAYAGETKHLHGLIQQCFGIQKIDDVAVLYFHAQRFAQLLFPPQLTLHTANPADKQAKFVIEMDYSHLVTYMQQLKGPAPLLYVFKPEESNIPILQPMFIGLSSVHQKPLLYVLIIDRSNSLAKHFAGIKEDVKLLIAQLHSKTPQAKLRIVFFAETCGPIKEFAIHEQENIHTFINSAQLGDSTHLHDTLREEVRHTKKRATDNDVALMLFSDGIDTTATYKGPLYTQALVNEICALAGGAEEQLSISFYSLGCGTEYNQPLLAGLAKKMRGDYFHLTQPDHLQQVINPIVQSSVTQSQSRILVDFRALIGTTEISYSIPVYANTSTSSSSTTQVYIPLQEDYVQLQSAGQKLVLHIPDPAKIPTGTQLDLINLAAVRARSLVADEDIALAEKVSRLAQQCIELKAIFTSNSSEQTAKDLVLQEMHNYLAQLKDAANNPFALKSICTQAQLRINFSGERNIANLLNAPPKIKEEYISIETDTPPTITASTTKLITSTVTTIPAEEIAIVQNENSHRPFPITAALVSNIEEKKEEQKENSAEVVTTAAIPNLNLPQ